MNGAESLWQTAIAAGIEVCFANPGTTEMPFVRALDDAPGVRAVLCLFEGVCTGAADGYGRMADKPALTLLHLGPGFANGIAYLHDARRARSPIVNLIGDHATWHLAADAPLTSDIVSLARPVSAWLRSNQSAEELAADAAEAIAAASQRPGRIATLIAPHDCQLNAGRVAATCPVAEPPVVSDAAIRNAATLLRSTNPTALFLGGWALREEGLRAAARIAAVTGCRLLSESFPARWERGAGLPVIDRLPYFPEQARAMLAPFQSIVLAGAKAPVSFFGYPGVPGYFISPEQQTAILATPEEDVIAALNALAEELATPPGAGIFASLSRPEKPVGPLTVESFAAAIAALQPEDAIIMNEGNTSSGAYDQLSATAPRHAMLTQPGGAIGLGPPCSTGAAIACPDRPVINIQADGSAMYTLQALWTQAREQLNVTTLICNNRSYRILGVELHRAGVTEFGPQARNLISLGNPPLDWVSLARGLGVPGVRVETADALVSELDRALSEPGPHLIEMML
jgi:acetolactate synthase-1/2/3 large subunit